MVQQLVELIICKHIFSVDRERLTGRAYEGAWRKGEIVLSLCSFLQGPTTQWRDELAEVAPFSSRKCPWRVVTRRSVSGYFRPFTRSSFCCPGFRNCIWRHEIMKKGYCFCSELSFENIETESTAVDLSQGMEIDGGDCCSIGLRACLVVVIK